MVLAPEVPLPSSSPSFLLPLPPAMRVTTPDVDHNAANAVTYTESHYIERFLEDKTSKPHSTKKWFDTSVDATNSCEVSKQAVGCVKLVGASIGVTCTGANVQLLKLLVSHTMLWGGERREEGGGHVRNA